MRVAITLISFCLVVVWGQQAGSTDYHPSLTTQACTASGCVDQATSVVLDSNWRWLHNVNGVTNCFSGNTWNPTYCSTPSSCATNCALEGVTSAGYSQTYGITTSGNALNLKFVTFNNGGKNVGSRVYLMDSASTYKKFYLKNREFAFDVDVSGLPCGINGALYFIETAGDGGLSYSGNNAGAAYGTGYCDAQCPHDIKFINGEANLNGWSGGKGQYGTCCTELDIWESNSISNAFTPHPCTITGQTRCTSAATCGDGTNRYSGYCDKDGCDFNPYRMGNQSFYGPGKTIDTSLPITVVTQFITYDGTDSGDLVEIKRYYKQNGVVIANGGATYPVIAKKDSITNDVCATSKRLFNNTNDFRAKGGMKATGDSMARGHVLVLSLWDDHDSNLRWLDSNEPVDGNPTTPGVARGSCSICSGDPLDVETNYPFANVKFSNIKYGAIGTTSGVPFTRPSSFVYADEVWSPFDDWSYAPKLPQGTAQVYEGYYSYEFTPKNYEAVWFSCSGCINTTKHSAIEFWINAGSGSWSSGVNIAMLRGTTGIITGPDNSVTTYTTVGTLPSNTWVKGTMSLTLFPAGIYNGFWFQDKTGAATTPTIYLDNIKLIGW